ncbi:hypothetical protein [Mycobacterium nebraskense]|uniref:Uncharacterized protein n=1 Tax=Mycobacterium nebraskense TaxID=244292 RepID=A0A0F5NIR3_9MYCO|nr:hypothetical protein [Mycobacterium nebraskense]KKC06966.1 hypothetical protein WU83_00455 [Mycobacterium nebraskense]KLO46716.1 hypothetical protein ABW17_02485 [Mycobacterium nebraskense]MBI2694531.1 hypothetical protein [Mycobacterium nebraskense]MCV7118246.1 hypothetical protein [Mycobacterium nebraskense]ORW27106.1 hypothetical protein AWC17_29590 [Mycobacterium nebraskense]
MRWFIRGLTAVIAVAFVAMAVSVIATPGISSAQCDHTMSFNPATFECKPPPPPPAWYTPPPPYAPSFAGQDVPPPPPWPSWSPNAPIWSTRFQHWGVYVGGTWVPL